MKNPKKKEPIVIFDEKNVAAGGIMKVAVRGTPLTQNDLDNTPEKRIERTRAKLTKIALFMNADKIEYRDLGKGEDYILTRGKKELILRIRGTPHEGGFLIS
jgi:hypothetical protein